MVYQVVIPKKVQKEIDKIPQNYKIKILAALTVLENDPSLGKKLEGEHIGYWSYRAWPSRIIYEIIKQKLRVLVVHISHRQRAYR